MAAPSPVSTNNQPPAKAGQLLPPDEKFWEKYSPHYEFPLSWVGSIAMHVLAVVLFLYLVDNLMHIDDKTPVPIRPMAVVGEDSDGGEGAPGSGGGDKEAVPNQNNPMDPQPFIQDVPLKDVQPLLEQFAPDLIPTNPDDLKTVPNLPNLDKFKKLNDELAKQLAKGLGGGKGSGDEPGKGDTGQAGKGDGGTGDANSTARRTLRWTLQFNTQSGRDYISQLAAMKATLLIPQPPDWSKANVIRDLSQPNPGKPLADVSSIKEMFFIDDRPDSVASVARDGLGLDFVPPHFIAFFPKDIEAELANKEKAYRGKNPNDIISTTFKIIIRDGAPTIQVIDQRARR